MEKALDKLFEAIDEIVSANATWAEKREGILAAAAGNESRSTNFGEFMSWFEEPNA